MLVFVDIYVQNIQNQLANKPSRSPEGFRIVSQLLWQISYMAGCHSAYTTRCIE